MKNQFIKRSLLNILYKKKQKMLGHGFRKLREPLMPSRSNSELKVNSAISKLSSVARIAQYLGN